MAISALRQPVYQPAMRIITNITQANPAIVTTSFANNYITGEVLRLNIPTGFGMVQANQKYAPITVINTTTFSIDIDTTFYDAFVIPGSAKQEAQVTPIGEENDILTAAVKNVLPYP